MSGVKGHISAKHLHMKYEHGRLLDLYTASQVMIDIPNLTSGADFENDSPLVLLRSPALPDPMGLGFGFAMPPPPILVAISFPLPFTSLCTEILRLIETSLLPPRNELLCPDDDTTELDRDSVRPGS